MLKTENPISNPSTQSSSEMSSATDDLDLADMAAAEKVQTVAEEAQNVLSHLLLKLQEPDSRYHSRYAKWIQRHQSLENFMFRCVRPEVWRYLQLGTKTTDALKSIGGDIRSDSRAVYFDAVLGLDRRIRLYIGQSFRLGPRIAQHWNFRYRRDNPSLHYHAIQNSIFNTFGILATIPSPNLGNHTLPGMDCPDLLLNVLETWMCLLFRSLPAETLEEYLPPGSKWAKDDVPTALNIASPLDQGSKSSWAWLDLSTSTDPLVQEYLSMEKKASSVEDGQGQKPCRHRQELEVGTSLGPVIVVAAAVLVGCMLLKGGGESARTRAWFR